jgi:hypothetical protein
MSVIYCEVCDRNVDLDLDDSHMSVGDAEYACNMQDDSEPAGDFSGASYDEWGGR